VDEVTKLITVTGEVSATVGALPLAAREQVTATLAFAAPDEGAFEVRLYERVDGLVVGGISFRWLDDDRTPPAVAGISPADGAVEVALGAPLVVTFTEAIGPLSLSLATTPDPGGWHLAWDASGTVLTATHSGLALTTTYAANVTAGDAFGNAMPAPYAWAFSTGKQAYWWIYLPVVMRHD
jgi:hypothetical protein